MRSCEIFKCAYAELLAVLWAELEKLVERREHDESADIEPFARLALGAEILQLELALLWDKCESLRVRTLINHEQASAMRALIAELRAHLDPGSKLLTWPQATSSITRAQNVLFDEVRRIGFADQTADWQRSA